MYYPLDKDLSIGYRYPPFEQLGPSDICQYYIDLRTALLCPSISHGLIDREYLSQQNCGLCSQNRKIEQKRILSQSAT